MKYQKIKRINHLANGDAALVKRDMFARKIIDLIDEGNHVFNLDESWLSNSSNST